MARQSGFGQLVLACFLVCAACRQRTQDLSAPSAVTPATSVALDAQASAAKAPPAPVDRRPVALEGYSKGPEDAPINIVVFSDYQCPFCSESEAIVERIFKAYPGKVRFFVRHWPLGGIHPDARLAAEAALAAGAQGNFWQMHDRLFANPKALKQPQLETYAAQIGLDVPKFIAALNGHAYGEDVSRDIAAGKTLGIRFTPVFFINGLPVGGAQPFEEFQIRIDQELQRIEKLLAAGIAPKTIYQLLMKDARVPAPSLPAAAKTTVSALRYNIPVGRAPVRGGTSPKVTIVEFSDFQCPFCAQAQETLDQVLKHYGPDVQLVFKHLPLPFHEQAAGAALAAESAGRQGKFWEMHDKLFANQTALDRDALGKYAQGLGLNVRKFWDAFDDVSLGLRLEANAKEAQRFGLNGTPSFFINGKLVRGALTLDGFKSVIDAEIETATAQIKAGVPRRQIYASITKDGLEKAQ